MNTFAPLVVACPVMKNNKNISMIARSASCFGVSKLIITGQNRIDKHISRDISIPIENHRSILPVISKYKIDGYRVIGLEQHPKAIKLDIFTFKPDTPTLMVVGNECRGIDEDVLNCLDSIIEISTTGKPKSLNVAVAASIVMHYYRDACEEFSMLDQFEIPQEDEEDDDDCNENITD
jgi:tRNA G18 (ribose-2'-O)-methylase SpoU